MKIRQVRIATVVLAAIIAAGGEFNLLFYIVAMQISLEILNRQPIYLQHPYKTYNFIFWAYDLVLLERLRSPQWMLSTDFEWWLNVLEHVAFGIIVCLKLYVYSAVFVWKTDNERWKRAVSAFIFFNLLGLVNEIFQNALAGRELFILKPDSIKDLWMNLYGALVFILTACARIVWMRRKANVYF